MATEARTFANRGNVPSSANATRDALSAGFRVLPNENQQEFDELIAEYHGAFAPATTHERFLVEEMAQSRWRLARIRRLETAVVEQMVAAADPADADAVLAAALIGNTAGPFKTLQRYAAAAERSYYRALKQLQAARTLEASGSAVETGESPSGLRVVSTPVQVEFPLPARPRVGRFKPAAILCYRTNPIPA
jgi:hypothetical protein